MKITLLKNYMVQLMVLLLLVSAGCKEKNSVGDASMIAGDSSKTWKATKETTADGKNDKISGEEKKQEMQFFSNGSFSMRSASNNASGKWTYDAMARTLALQFVGSDMTENFQVLSLTKDKMKLQAGDGSQMTLESD